MPWPEARMENWTQFTQMTQSLAVGSPAQRSYAYRGQSCASWDLKPSLSRFLTDNASVATAINAEITALSAFKHQIPLHAESPTRFQISNPTLREWWSLMQHYGAPTRLLDWTSSPFVALYFACCGNPSEDGAIWLFRIRDFSDAMSPGTEAFRKGRDNSKSIYWDQEPSSAIELFYPEEAAVTSRIVAQQGLFSISYDPTTSHDQTIDSSLTGARRTSNKAGTIYFKVVIPSELKLLFLRNLRSMNVTASSLFPGIDGLGRSVSELLSLHMQFHSENV